MTRKATTVTREQLYQQVWQEPATKLAQRYGISDVALAKACRKHHIPRPPRGHWAKLQHGKAVAQEPLPPLEDGRLQEVRFNRAASHSFHDPQLIAKDDDASAVNVVVPDRLSTPHPLVTSTRELFTRNDGGRPDSEEEQQQMLELKVSRQSLPRALRIMDTLIKAWESLGGRVWVARDWFDRRRWCTCFGMGKDFMPVAMEERQKRVAGSRGWDYQWQYTGRLALQVDRSRTEKLRRTWADGNRQRLECILDSFISVLLQYIDAERHHRLDCEIEGRHTRRAKARREAAQQREVAEQQRRQDLEQEADLWHRACRIRQYVTAIEAKVNDGRLQPHDKDAFTCWLRWAHWYTDHLDPLAYPEPLSEEKPERPTNLPLSELELTSYTRPVLEKIKVRDTDELYQLSEKAIEQAEEDGRHPRVWGEVCRILEGLGYDTSGRRYWLL